MALTKQPVNINFSQGVDQKVDPYQIPIGKFKEINNATFIKGGRLTKRNGFASLPASPSSSTSLLSTFGGGLVAVGTSLESYSPNSTSWTNKGALTPISVSTNPVVRSNTSQDQADSVTSSSGLTCIAYTDQDPSNLSAKVYKYAIVDSSTGQYVVNPTSLSSADATYGAPRVFLLGNYFVIVYTTHPASYSLEYIAISIASPTVITASTVITSSYVPASTLSWDGVVVSDRLFIAYNTTSGGQAIKIAYLSSTLYLATATTFSGRIATMMSLTYDVSGNNSTSPVVWTSFYDSAGSTGYTFAVDVSLNQILAPTQFISSGTIKNLTSTATSDILKVYYEVDNAYSYSATKTNYINTNTITRAGVVGTASALVRGVGLASKAFTVDSVDYFSAVYNSSYQPTYFLINSSGKVVSILAPSNAGGYLTSGLPNVTVSGSDVRFTYQRRDLIQSINRTAGSSNSTGVYAQTGINLAKLSFDSSATVSSEIGGNLILNTGFLASFDGVGITENGFFLYPEDLKATISATGGSVTQQQYYYQVTYEWADNQGNIYRSAPSIPLSANVTVGAGAASVTLDIPTLRLTHKTATPVKIVIYRWSTAQQGYYQVTSISTPTLNSTSVDSIQYVDTKSDSQILGNNLIYTTGGVVENTSVPSASSTCLFDNRLFTVNAEDRNLIQFSKQVIQSTPVEMSDLLSIYAAPATATQVPSGGISAIYPMDDKLAIFKQSALGYIAGAGPDSTGANSQYSEFTLINATVGCSNQRSIVLTPNGLMFESATGIWLLGRDLSTSYIGAPVEDYTNDASVTSAVNVPNSTQVRFTLSSGITLMYDYYYNQWGTFTGVPEVVSSVIYNGLHTLVTDSGRTLQELPGSYLDGSRPVLMNFKTGWINLAGLQGFERFYEMLLLGTYYTPFKLVASMAYDYSSPVTHSVTIEPDNYSEAYGDAPLYGSGTYGGESNVFESRVFPERQKCESFQITVQEVYDSSKGQPAGQGLTLSGINLTVGLKKGSRNSSSARSFG